MPRVGVKRLTKPGCHTNAGQNVTVTMTHVRGAKMSPKLIYKRAGAVFIRTRGGSHRVRITWSAPATGTYAAYKQTRTYRA